MFYSLLVYSRVFTCTVVVFFFFCLFLRGPFSERPLAISSWCLTICCTALPPPPPHLPPPRELQLLSGLPACLRGTWTRQRHQTASCVPPRPPTPHLTDSQRTPLKRHQLGRGVLENISLPFSK